jgi:hypothetical protein
MDFVVLYEVKKKKTFVETTFVSVTATNCQQLHCLSDLHFSPVEELFKKKIDAVEIILYLRM